MAIEIKAHVTGKVWKIEAKLDDMVEEGTVVVILESMNMEMPVESEEEGVVDRILVREGQEVKEGQPLIELR